MSLLIVAIAAVLGALMGGLVNACVLRTKKGLAFTIGRKKCSTCAMPLALADHVPIASYLRLKGKCRRCSSVMPWQYLAVEVVLAALFALFAYHAFVASVLPSFVAALPLTGEPLGLFVRNAIVATLFVPIFMFDLRSSIIPDRLTIPAIIIALLMNAALGMNTADMLLGGLAIGSFFAVQMLASRGAWVGGGDVRMGLLIGFLLGFKLGLVALLLAYALGSIVGIWLIMSGRRNLHSHVPFGTFMVLGALVAMFVGEQILTWYVAFFR